jgi:hypothetical protein
MIADPKAPPPEIAAQAVDCQRHQGVAFETQ